MTPRAQRTDPIYNRCLICGQAGHCRDCTALNWLDVTRAALAGGAQG